MRRRKPLRPVLSTDEHIALETLVSHGYSCSCHWCERLRPYVLAAGHWRLCYSPGELEIVRT